MIWCFIFFVQIPNAVKSVWFFTVAVAITNLQPIIPAWNHLLSGLDVFHNVIRVDLKFFQHSALYRAYDMRKGSVKQIYFYYILFFHCWRSGCTTIHIWKMEPPPRRTGWFIVILCHAEWAAFTEVFSNMEGEKISNFQYANHVNVDLLFISY